VIKRNNPENGAKKQKFILISHYGRPLQETKRRA
jgi:hypothetical protein